MRKALIVLAAWMVTGVCIGQTFTDLNNPKLFGKTKDKQRAVVIDANFAAVEGGPTLSATTSAADSWAIKSTQPTTTGLVSTVTLMDNSTAQTDTDYIQVDLFEGVNDSAESTVWGSVRVVVDDNTTNTEDSAIEVYIPVAGVQTKVVDIDASGAAVAGDVSGTTIGGITEANLVDKSAGEAVSGTWTFTTLNLSATQWFDIVNTTQLVFIAAGVTNVIDADITTP